MNDSRYRTRPFRDGDFEPISRLITRLQPDQPITSEELRQWFLIFRDPRFTRLDLIVEERSSAAFAGYGTLYHVPDMYHPRRFWAEVAVDPDHQHRGIGRTLYNQVEELARARSAEILWSSVWTDELRSVRFFGQAGFIERRRRWGSRLDLGITSPTTRGGEPIRLPPGVTFTTLAEEGADRRDVQERLYHLELATSRDEPRMEVMTDISFEQYSEYAFHGPRYFPEAVFLARAGDEYVAMTTLTHLPAEPGVLMVGFTGTLPDYRGRGLATELKRRAMEFARASGFRYLKTFNDSENPAIWAINRKLGFQIQRVRMTGEKKFGP